MRILIASIVLLAIVVLPLLTIYHRAKHGKGGKTQLIVNFCCFFGLIAFATVFLFTQSAEAAEASKGLVESDAFASGMQYIAAALAVGLSGIGGGVAVASSASAALGALSENEEIFGKSLIFVGLAEGVALYGMLIAFMILPTA
ncbi:MAG: ATPase [Clostridiales bacterium]|nr:ATPase [Clostridiales bacterium]